MVIQTGGPQGLGARAVSTIRRVFPSVRMRFDISMPHYFSYEYKQVGTKGEEGYGVELSAYGDLDCDGTYSTYVWSGIADGKMGPGITSAGVLMETKPLE